MIVYRCYLLLLLLALSLVNGFVRNSHVSNSRVSSRHYSTQEGKQELEIGQRIKISANTDRETTWTKKTSQNLSLTKFKKVSQRPIPECLTLLAMMDN